jgi:uncharacterized membrane protein YgdD (TMEM256/DUF423 family)
MTFTSPHLASRPGLDLLIFSAALSGAVAVAAGAFAAHGAGPQVKTLLTTGAHYQLAHAVLAIVAALMGARLAGWLALIGSLIFALSLYLMGGFSLMALGVVTPVGGLIMIAGWIVLAFGLFRSSSVKA